MKWYMIVTADKYELPVAIFPRAKHAARWLGYSDENSIFHAINVHKKMHNGYIVERIEI